MMANIVTDLLFLIITFNSF